MPTYDYLCDSCGHRFDAFQSMKDDPLTVCPSCSDPTLRRVITGGAGVIFRGSGFYVTDSRPGSGSPGTSPKTGDAAAATAAPGAASAAPAATGSEKKAEKKSETTGSEKKTA